LGAALLLNNNAFAATDRTWTGSAGDGLASNPTNWSLAGAPQNGDDLIISGSIEFNLGATPINSIETTDCATSITGSLVIISSITSAGCDSTWYDDIPTFAASVTLAGDAVIDGWNIVEYNGIPVIDAGSFHLRMVNIITPTSPAYTAMEVIGTGTLTIGRVGQPVDGIMIDPLTFRHYFDDVDGLDFSGFTGTLEIIGAVGFTSSRMPLEAVINIRQGGLMLLENLFGDEDAVSSKINIYSDLSMVFMNGANVSNITLYRNTTLIYLDIDLDLIADWPYTAISVVDLTGINLNGFCIEYGVIDDILVVADWDDGSAYFIPEMAECVENPGGGDNGGGGTDNGGGNGGDGSPGTPNTGFFTKSSGGLDGSAILSTATGGIVALGIYLKLRRAGRLISRF